MFIENKWFVISEDNEIERSVIVSFSVAANHVMFN